MKVKATQRGFWPHNRERQPGEQFEYDGPLKKKGSDGKDVPYFPNWMEKLEKPKSEAKPAAGQAAKQGEAQTGE